LLLMNIACVSCSGWPLLFLAKLPLLLVVPLRMTDTFSIPFYAPRIHKGLDEHLLFASVARHGAQ
jgi:hypothetical protein